MIINHEMTAHFAIVGRAGSLHLFHLNCNCVVCVVCFASRFIRGLVGKEFLRQLAIRCLVCSRNFQILSSHNPKKWTRCKYYYIFTSWQNINQSLDDFAITDYNRLQVAKFHRDCPFILTIVNWPVITTQLRYYNSTCHQFKFYVFHLCSAARQILVSQQKNTETLIIRPV